MNTYNTIKDAVEAILPELAGDFSILDITKKLRQKLNDKEIMISNLRADFINELDGFGFRLNHSDVRDAFLSGPSDAYDQTYTGMGFRIFTKKSDIAASGNTGDAPIPVQNPTPLPTQPIASQGGTSGKWVIEFNGAMFATRKGKAVWNRKSDAMQAFSWGYFTATMRGHRNRKTRKRILRQLRKSGELIVTQKPIFCF